MGIAISRFFCRAPAFVPVSNNQDKKRSSLVAVKETAKAAAKKAKRKYKETVSSVKYRNNMLLFDEVVRGLSVPTAGLLFAQNIGKSTEESIGLYQKWGFDISGIGFFVHVVRMCFAYGLHRKTPTRLQDAIVAHLLNILLNLQFLNFDLGKILQHFNIVDIPGDEGNGIFAGVFILALFFSAEKDYINKLSFIARHLASDGSEKNLDGSYKSKDMRSFKRMFYEIFTELFKAVAFSVSVYVGIQGLPSRVSEQIKNRLIIAAYVLLPFYVIGFTSYAAFPRMPDYAIKYLVKALRTFQAELAPAGRFISNGASHFVQYLSACFSRSWAWCFETSVTPNENTSLLDNQEQDVDIEEEQDVDIEEEQDLERRTPEEEQAAALAAAQAQLERDKHIAHLSIKERLYVLYYCLALARIFLSLNNITATYLFLAADFVSMPTMFFVMRSILHGDHQEFYAKTENTDLENQRASLINSADEPTKWQADPNKWQTIAAEFSHSSKITSGKEEEKSTDVIENGKEEIHPPVKNTNAANESVNVKIDEIKQSSYEMPLQSLVEMTHVPYRCII